MCDTEKIITQGFLALKKILEDGVRGGSDTIELEYGNDGLEVFHITGGVGLGKVFSDPDLIRGIIRAVIQTAGLERRHQGEMRMVLLGEERTIMASQHDSFGEWSYRLEMDPASGMTNLNNI